MLKRKVSSEAGETYVELLVTLVIVGLVAVAIMGAIMTSVTSSSVHRNLTNDETVLRSAVEQFKYQAELSPTPLFTSSDDCGASGVDASTILASWNSSMASLWPSIPSGIQAPSTPWISQVTCLSETSGSPGSQSYDCYATMATPSSPVSLTTPNGGSCLTTDQSGILLVTISFKDQSNLISSLSTVVRNPGYDANYTQANFS